MSNNKFSLMNLINDINKQQKEKKIFLIHKSTNEIKDFLKVLLKEGYIFNFILLKDKYVKVYFKYGRHGLPVIKNIDFLKKQSRYISLKKEGLIRLNSDDKMSTYIVSTNKGFKTSKEAIQENLGGLLICKIN